MDQPQDTKTNRLKFTKEIKWVSVIGMVLSLLGIADGVDLTIAHYTTPTILACPSTGFINCAKVTTSSYSEIFGIPVALLGLLFFVAMFFLQVPHAWRSHNKWLRLFRLLFSISGLLMIFWFIYVELHKLHAICLYCTAAHILTFGIFVVTVVGTSIIVHHEELIT